MWRMECSAQKWKVESGEGERPGAESEVNSYGTTVRRNLKAAWIRTNLYEYRQLVSVRYVERLRVVSGNTESKESGQGQGSQSWRSTWLSIDAGEGRGKRRLT